MGRAEHKILLLALKPIALKVPRIFPYDRYFHSGVIYISLNATRKNAQVFPIYTDSAHS